MKTTGKYKNWCTILWWLLVAMLVRSFTHSKKNRVFFISYGFQKYACNPKAITEYLLKYNPEYEIFWAFEKGVDISNLNPKINVVRKFSFAYLNAIYTSRFIYNNSRNNIFGSAFIKRKDQKYIQTWHSSIRLKKIEADAASQLGENYIKVAKKDSLMADLMLSNSKMYNELIRRAFMYDGEILERCIPRNDVYYDKGFQEKVYKIVRDKLDVSHDTKIVLYAPTFRKDMNNLEYYRINWDLLMPYLRKMLGGNVEVLVRLHPNMSKIPNINTLVDYPGVHDVTQALDITEYLFAADILISDYTSAMFDFIILKKPCFIYAIDKNEYDRGFYWSLDQLPFPFASSYQELAMNICNFDADKYYSAITKFKDEIWGLEEDGCACQRLLSWMKQNS